MFHSIWFHRTLFVPWNTFMFPGTPLCSLEHEWNYPTYKILEHIYPVSLHTCIVYMYTIMANKPQLFKINIS